jgi:hypothetical protein
MNKCLFQFWEESVSNNNPLPDGCSISINSDESKKFIDKIYSIRKSEVPQEYSRIVGSLIDCFVSDELYGKILLNGSIRLNEVEKNNLIELEEIIFKE